MYFSKSKVLAGLRCEKQLYLYAHHPELANQSTSPTTVTGQVVEEYAHREFPNAVLVERGSPGSDPYEATKALLADNKIKTIFEAGIRDNELALFVDVLQRNGSAWELTEIKAGTRVEDRHIDDVAIQALALARSGIPVNRFWLMHINPDFVYHGQHNYRDLFVREDITEQVEHHILFINNQIPHMQSVVVGAQPERHIGSYCNNPYPCAFKAYCVSQEPAYPVAYLPNGWRVAQTLIAQGIYDIRDIPPDALKSETHQRVRRVTKAAKAEILPGAKEELDALDWPRYYLDFECVQFAIPIWEDTRPYAQLPFQWSCHIKTSTDTLEHLDFLDTSGRDPRRAFAEALLEACGEWGPIIVYNQSFEKRIIRELAETFTDLQDRLLALNARVFDLLPVVKQNYYHPDMKGSWSIKNVLPCLVPELSYSDLGDVQDGIQAQAGYLTIIGGELNSAKQEALRQDLLSYCELDTYAMVAIVNRLIKGVGDN